MSDFEILAPEILQRIGENLGDADLAHLAQTNNYFADSFAEILFTRSMEDKPPRVVKVPALMWAIDYGHLTLVERILSQPDFDFETGQIGDALFLAATVGHPEIIEALVESGWDIESCDHRDRNALHLAALHGNSAAADVLMDYGAEISDTDASGRTAFILAIEAPHDVTSRIHLSSSKVPTRDVELKYEMERRVVSTVQSLLKGGAEDELSSTNSRGETPLHLAVLASDRLSATDRSDLVVGSAVIRLLIDHGASSTAQNQDNETPIDLAVNGKVACTTALNCFLDLGLDPNSKSHSDKSLLHRVVGIKRTEYAYNNAELLLKRGAVIDFNLWDFFHAQEQPNELIFDKLLTLLSIHGAQFNGAESDCFIIAVYHGMLSIMDLLFQRGCDINAEMSSCRCHRHRRTALEVAVARNNTEALQFLIDHGVRMTDSEKRQVDRVMENGSSAGSSPVSEPDSWLRTSFPIRDGFPTGQSLDRD